MGTASNRPATRETGSRRWPTKKQRARLALDRQTEGLVFARSMRPQPLTRIVQDKVANGKTTRANSTKAPSLEYLKIWLDFLSMRSPNSHHSTLLALPDQSEIEPSSLPRDIIVTGDRDCADRASGSYYKDTPNLVTDYGGCTNLTQREKQRQQGRYRQEDHESVPDGTKLEENTEDIFAFEEQIPETQDPGSKNPVVPTEEFFRLLPIIHRKRNIIYNAGPSLQMLGPLSAPPSPNTSTSRSVFGSGSDGSDASTSRRTGDGEIRVHSSDNKFQSMFEDEM